MGTQNSRSSFKNNSSMLASNHKYEASEQFSFNKSKNKSINKDMDILTKFTWNYGGNTVMLTGSFNRWKQTIPLQRHGDQFSITILLPRGLHYYKFIVDGEWRFTPQDPSVPDANGNINNYIDTTNFFPLMDNKKRQIYLSIIPGTTYHLIQSEYSGPVFNQNNQRQKPQLTSQAQKGIQQFPKLAPLLPIHYQYCQYLTNAEQPEQMNENLGRQRTTLSDMMEVEGEEKRKFQLSLSEAELKQIFNSCHCLAPPNHVTVDHIARQTKKQYEEIAITQRFKSKYTTYRYYS